MSKVIQRIQHALQRAESIRPKAGGFPYLAECLRQAGAVHNYWELPSCQCTFLTDEGAVTMTGRPLVEGMVDVQVFDQAALIRALRADQAGETSFPEFLRGSWEAGVVRYDVDFNARTVSYFGANGEVYVEEYPAVTL